MTLLDDVRSDLEVAAFESDSAAINTLWLALTKLAKQESGALEFDRLLAVVNRISEATMRAITEHRALDSLLALQPPLETLLSNPHETLRTKKVTAAIQRLRSSRSSDPQAALAALLYLLKTVHDKRDHSFKSRHGVREDEVTFPSRVLLDQLCWAALRALQC
jgi:hypothetical protein